MDNKLDGARNNVRTMLYYYIVALVEAGDPNPKETITKQIGDMIGLAEDQIAFVEDKLTSRTTMDQQLECAVELLQAIEKSKKLDMESVRIVTKLIQSIRASYKEAIDKFIEDAKDIQKEQSGETNDT